MDTKKTLLGSTLALLLAGFAGLAPPPADAQITSFEDTPFHVTLTRLPGVGTSDMGVCTGFVDPTSGSLEIICTRPAESSGDVLVTLGPPSEGNVQFDLGGGQVVSTTRNLSDEQVAMFLTGRLWVAMTTPSHSQGAIGARLVPRTPVGEHVMRFPMLEESLVHSGSSKTGHCALTLDADIETANLLCFHDVSNPGELRVIIDGGVVATRSNVDSPFEVSLPVIIDQHDRLLQGHIGVVLTSAAFPNGEIGMVLDRCIEGPNTLCLNAERFRVTVEVTPPGQATRLAGTVPDRSKDAGLFWFFNPDNWEVMLKVLDACSSPNPHFWVFLSANTTVAFEVTVYDTLTGRTQTYSNPPDNLAAPRADLTAFSCS